MKILIVDDESSARILLLRKLEKHQSLFSLVHQADGVKSAMELLENNHYDLIFLDIQMPDGSGFDLLETMGNHESLIAFTTAYDEFALKALEFAAIGYLLKPIDPEKLSHIVHLATQMKVNQNSQYNLLLSSYRDKKVHKLVIPNTEGFFIAEISDIVYIKSDINYSVFYFKDSKNSIVSSKTLKEYSRILEPEGFFRIHQSYLINLGFAREFKKTYNEVVLTDGTHLPVARQKKSSFQSLFV